MKRNAFLRLLAIVAILPISTTMKAQGADDDASARLEIMVGSEREFLDAIGNERTIILREGTTLNLTNVLDNESLFNKSGRAFISEGANISKATIVSQEVVDGRQLTLANLHDLTI
nr:hypothetical protein [Prevotella sp.]